jgi:hypothetical protein
MRRALKIGVYGTFFIGAINLAFALARFRVIELGTDQYSYLDIFPLIGKSSTASLSSP